MLRGVEFDIDAFDLCHLLFVPSTDVQVFESKTWTQVDDFDPAAVVRHLTRSTAYGVG